MRNPRPGFTLIELLVVITVIVILAGLIIPTIGLIRQQSRTAESKNNLRQIGGAIETYRLEVGPNTERTWPGYLGDMVAPGMPLEGARNVLIDPNDPTRGADSLMGRPKNGWGDQPWVRPLHDNDPMGAKDKLSYMYEMSEEPIEDPNLMNWFYRFPDEHPIPSEAIWQEAKHHQMANGNFGQPFPKTRFPIVRSYWSHRWSGDGDKDDEMEEVLNLSASLQVFSSPPTWEQWVNPDFASIMD